MLKRLDTGNDYNGWEFYKDTKVLYGSVIIGGKTFKNPKPKSMRSRPDKMICEYELDEVTIREEKFIAANDAAAYFTLDGLFRQGLAEEASELTLNHLANYNWHNEWQIPVAPEAYRRDLTFFGDQYSNFNAGKILLYLEGLAGLKVSIPDQQLTIRPALPDSWEWMELRLPIANQWTRIRYTPEGVQVRGCPLPVSAVPAKKR